MNKIFTTTLLCLALAAAAFSQTKNFIDQPYIEVTGHADTFVTPNEIYIEIIISERDSRDRVSIEEQENKMIAALNALNINTQDLKTSDILSNYKSYFLKQKEIQKTKVYILKVSDASTVSKVFIELEAIGISNTSIQKVKHSDYENIKNECRAVAIVNANQKAIAFTKPLSQSIGNAIHIADDEATNTTSIQRVLNSAPGIIVTHNDGYNKNENPTIEFEKINIAAKVTVKFILK